MNRVHRFRTARKSRFKYCIAITLFLGLLISGVCVVDYSVNSITKNVYSVEIFKLTKIDEIYYEVSFANSKLYVNTMYLKRDMENLKSKITSMF